MDLELKPCPFCGEKAKLDFAHENFVYTGDDGVPRMIGFFYTVKCINQVCGCVIGTYRNTEMAIEAWNRRKSDGNKLLCGKK